MSGADRERSMSEAPQTSEKSSKRRLSEPKVPELPLPDSDSDHEAGEGDVPLISETGEAVRSEADRRRQREERMWLRHKHIVSLKEVQARQEQETRAFKQQRRRTRLAMQLGTMTSEERQRFEAMVDDGDPGRAGVAEEDMVFDVMGLAQKKRRTSFMMAGGA